jgi:hypothetical protein
MRYFLYFLIFISSLNNIYSQRVKPIHSIGVTFSGGFMNRNTTSNIIGQDTLKPEFEPIYRVGLNYSLRYRKVTFQNEVLLTSWTKDGVYWLDIPLSVKFHPFRYKFRPFLEFGVGPSIFQENILLNLQYAIGVEVYLFNRVKMVAGLRPIHQFPINVKTNYRTSLLTLFTTINIDL